MIDIYYHPISPPAITVLLAAEAVGVEYEKKMVDLQSGEQRSEAYMKINRYSRVPALKDGDFTLSESAAMMRYLAKRQGSGLYPTDTQAAAVVDQWTDFVIHHVRTPVGRVQFNRVVAPMIGQEVDEKSLAFGLHLLESNLPIIEERLAENAFLCGDEMTLADVALVGALDPTTMCKIDLTPYKKLTEWLASRRTETFYTNVHTHFGAEIGM